MNDYSEAGRRHSMLAGAAALLLGAAAIALALWPRAIETLTGVRRAEAIAAPDDLPRLSTADTTPFFHDRDQLEIRVAEATTLRHFLDRNRLNKPFHRRQIVEQLGSASPDAVIAPGSVFRIRLTPVAEDVPGIVSRPE